MAVWGAVIVAAGKGKRMGTKESKQYLTIGNKPILAHTLERICSLQRIKHVVTVVGRDDVERIRQYPQQYAAIHRDMQVISGGDERQASVYKGLSALPKEVDYVLVHDGVRPFTKISDMEACMDKAEEMDAAVLAIPVKDTIKIVNADHIVQSTPDRSTLWAVQTPQAFRLDSLLNAHRKAAAETFFGTDDAMLMEWVGKAVSIVPGDETNIKITTPKDLSWAEWILTSREREEG